MSTEPVSTVCALETRLAYLTPINFAGGGWTGSERDLLDALEMKDHGKWRSVLRDCETEGYIRRSARPGLLLLARGSCQHIDQEYREAGFLPPCRDQYPRSVYGRGDVGYSDRTGIVFYNSPVCTDAVWGRGHAEGAELECEYECE